MLGLISELSATWFRPRNVAGTIPQMPARRTPVARALATHLDPHGAAARAFQAISSTLLETRVVLVTSQDRFNGVSVCAANLAIALAQARRSVVLIDANLAHPIQHSHFYIEANNGLGESIESPACLRWSIVATDVDRLHVLPAGTMKRPARDLLACESFRTIINTLSSQFDHVVIDTPPMCDPGADDSQSLSRCGTMLRIANRQTITVHPRACRS